MNIVISALHFPWTNMRQCLQQVEDWGLDGVELSWVHPLQRPGCTRDDLQLLHSLRERPRRLMAHIWDDLAQLGLPRATQALRNWLDLCDYTGVQGLVVHGGTWPDQAEGIRRTQQVLHSILDDFERRGVVLYLENHYAFTYRGGNELFSEPWEFREVLPFHKSALQFCFDTGHGHMTRNWQELVMELAPWLGHVHLADNHGVHDDHCMFRQGTVPWDDVLATLRHAGFDGTFCVEFPVREDQRPFRECVETIRKMWA